MWTNKSLWYWINEILKRISLYYFQNFGFEYDFYMIVEINF